MSGRISTKLVDFTAASPAFDCVRCVLMRSFLERNWCGCTMWSALEVVETVLRCISSAPLSMNHDRFRFRRARRLYAADPMRPGAVRQHGGSEMHARCVDPEILSLIARWQQVRRDSFGKFGGGGHAPAYHRDRRFSSPSRSGFPEAASIPPSPCCRNFRRCGTPGSAQANSGAGSAPFRGRS
jgi:hypothetical protein